MSYTIETILIKDLAEYIESDRWDDKKIIPITPERARSQQKNPNALPDDPGLWVAVSDEDGEVIGFCGNLPGWDRFNNRRMGWNTCWWVDPNRGQETAMPLFYRFLQFWDYHVAFADMTPRTRAIVDALGFCHTWGEPLIIAYFRLSALKIRSKLGFAGKILYPFFFIGTFLVKCVQEYRLRIAVRMHNQVQSELCDQLDEEMCDFIEKYIGNNFYHRSLEEYAWIYSEPWLTDQDSSAGKNGRRYPFSYKMKEYKMEWLVSRKDQKIIAVSLISTRDGTLKILYSFGEQSSELYHGILWKVSQSKSICSLIATHRGILGNKDEITSVCLGSKTRRRYAGVSERILSKFPEEMWVQFGDGDSVFT